MNKKELVAGIADMNDMTKSDVAKTLDATLEMIQDALSEGEDVVLPGFGKFSVSHRAARKGRNPATGETIQIKASKGPKFKAGKTFKDAVNV